MASPVSANAGHRHCDRLPDAEILAADTLAIITDPDDPRLDDRLLEFKREVKRIIRNGGGRPRGSQLLDGVFFSSLINLTTFQRSRDFDVDSVSRTELHDIAPTMCRAPAQSGGRHQRRGDRLVRL